MLNNIALFLDKYKEQLNLGVEGKVKVSNLIKNICGFEPKNIKIDESKGVIKFDASPIERSVFLERQSKIKIELETILKTKISRIG